MGIKLTNGSIIPADLGEWSFLIDHEIILVVIVCAALWTQKFKEITSKIHMTPMRGGSIDLFDPKLEGLRQEPVQLH